jgi:hypothetical protein
MTRLLARDALRAPQKGRKGPASIVSGAQREYGPLQAFLGKAPKDKSNA